MHLGEETHVRKLRRLWTGICVVVQERLKGTKFPKAQREFVLNGIERALRENSKLPSNTRCNLPNSSFRIELEALLHASQVVEDWGLSYN